MRARAEVPQALHLARLAQGSPGEWVQMPGGQMAGGPLRVVSLSGTLAGAGEAGWLVCLSGEAVVDLPLSNFVRLRPAEGYRVTPGEAWTAFSTKENTVLMLVAE